MSGPGGNIATSIAKIVIDQPASALPDGSLSDFEGSAYRLRRIVGKLWVGVEVEQFTTQPSLFVVTAGFIILRVDTSGNPLSSGNNYHPQILDSERDPWIWRRSWLLRNNIVRDNAFTNFGGFNRDVPSFNGAYGSVADGPHVDAKTARIVSDEERLFLVVGFTTLDGAQETSGIVTWLADLRVLASMKTSSGNRRNASR